MTETLSGLVARLEDVEPPADVDAGTCTICAFEGPVKPIRGTNGVFSNAFTTDPELGPGDGVCYRCEHLANAMDYRRYHWLASVDGVQVIKERPVLIEHLLDPPTGPWMAQYKDGSDFLTVLNGWIVGQRLNHSREQFDIIVDKRRVSFEREPLAEMIAFGRDLRSRDDAPSKRALIQGVTAGDLGRYDLSHDEARRINDELVGREDWRIAAQLIE